MDLPDFLTDDGTGEIRVQGHRVWLHHVVRQYAAGGSAEMIALTFPSLPLSLIHKVLAFYLENRDALDAYLIVVAKATGEHAGAFDAARGEPVVAELRRRAEAMRSAGAA